MLYSSGKEGSIVKWDLSSGQRLATFPRLGGKPKGKGKEKAHEPIEGHVDEVLSLALSSDNKYLVSGGKDRKVIVWGVQEEKWVKSFTGHRDTISVSVSNLPACILFELSVKVSCIQKRLPPIIQRLI